MAVNAASCLYNTRLAVSQRMQDTLKHKKTDYVESLTTIPQQNTLRSLIKSNA